MSLRWYTSEPRPRPNWHRAHKESLHWSDSLADHISAFIGSWWYVWLHTVWFLLRFDLALDINLLTLIVSLEAIFLCIFLLMSGNRQSERDRHQAEADYLTNVEAKREIEELMRRISRLETEKLDRLLAIQEMHFASINAFFADLPKKSAPARRKPKTSRK